MDGNSGREGKSGRSGFRPAKLGKHPSGSKPKLRSLRRGRIYLFAKWPNLSISEVVASVYTVWNGDLFLYVGMSGRGWSTDRLKPLEGKGGKRRGLVTRLASHSSGRRSGGQFCVYACDRLVIPKLSRLQLKDTGSGDQERCSETTRSSETQSQERPLRPWTRRRVQGSLQIALNSRQSCSHDDL